MSTDTPLRIWGRMSSINVRKVVWTVQELGLSAQRTDAGGHFGLVTEPEYRGKNPNGMVPLLEDGEVTLWESNVIVRYLCARHAAGTLYPEPLAQRFAAEMWMDWQQTTLNPAGRDAFVQLIRTPAEQRVDAAIARSFNETEPLLDLLDAELARRPFLAGDSFTMADIPVACEVHRWNGLPFDRTPRPHLDRWYQAVAERPGAVGVLDQPLS
ncbi:glutathione S-transferase family protein [Pseudorhodoferax sp. Leaf267]|uniref:glutathione S-transferase family protein n=1 Tax=Pseudorhodoferax sp. Leaf267 TaxID=1736316 RepID=UPI0006FA4B3B|nr:glutathione S-transferase [Pseudorhodoferax sp. Leaf267]KQP21766.1 glutathione S-transferase [Pseudorhodoferax sp. Leaf267]